MSLNYRSPGRQKAKPIKYTRQNKLPRRQKMMKNPLHGTKKPEIPKPEKIMPSIVHREVVMRNDPPLPIPLPAPYIKGAQTPEWWRKGPPQPPRPLNYNQWIATHFPVVPLIDELCKHLRQQGFPGNPWAQLCMADPSALSDAGLTILGKTYEIPAELRSRIVSGEKLIDTPWNEPRDYMAWHNQTREQYANYLNTFNNGE